MHNQEIFAELAIVLVIVAIVAAIMRVLRQPLILGYILTGIIVGPFMLDLINSKEAFEGFSEIGIALLLFIIGLGMNINVIKNLGKVSVATAGSILVLVGGASSAAVLAMGYDVTTAIIVGLAAFFSSTIVILKVLGDKGEANRLHGQVAIGVVLVDDVVATLAILAVSAISQSDGGSLGGFDMLWLATKAFLLAGGLIIMSTYIVPKYAKRLAKSQELLFLFAIAWAFGVAHLFSVAGFSHEVGALFAGVSLAGLPYAVETASRLKPLRDFFIVLFFVYLGEIFVFDDVQGVIVPAIILSLITLIGKPLFVMSALGALGYTKFTSFKTAIHLSQISEFSIVLVVFAATNGIIDETVVSIITLVALITIAISSYLMQYDDILFKKYSHLLNIFERENIKEKKQSRQPYSAVLFGYHHGGHEFLKLFRELKKRYLVIDFNPEIIEHLDSRGIRNAYGDVTDPEFLEEIDASSAKLAASTIADMETNRLLLTHLRRHNPDIVFICHASTHQEALELYELGASYVILPRFIGSHHISTHLIKNGINNASFKRYRQKHIIDIGRSAIKQSK
ncbi:cation:proton antiporter [Candidatus Nomurabacteria bacterium]|nr:cation:proton antiporter [Candidatus Nomurabacteria bacterium]